MNNKKQATHIFYIAVILFVFVIISFILSKFPLDASPSTKLFWGTISLVMGILAIVFLKYKNNYIKINDLFKDKK